MLPRQNFETQLLALWQLKALYGVDVAAAAGDDDVALMMYFEPVVLQCLYLNYHLNNCCDHIAADRQQQHDLASNHLNSINLLTRR